MKHSRRVLIWLLETCVQMLLLALLLIALFGYDKGSFGRALLVFSVCVGYMFFFTGYLFTTAAARLFWKGRTAWLYAALASTLFLLHFELLNLGLGGAFAPHERHLIFAVGAVMVATVSLFGTHWMSKTEPLRQVRP